MKKLICFTVCAVMILVLNAGYSEAGTYSGYFGLDNIVEISGGNNSVIIPEPPLGAVMDSESFNIISPHDKKNPVMTYARNVQKIYKGGLWNTTVQMKGELVAKPAAKNSVPREKNGLLNPRNPVIVQTNQDNVILWIEQQKLEFQNAYELRMLDTKGKTLGKVTYDSNRAEIKISHTPQDYYLEFSLEWGNGKRYYYYVLLRINTTDSKPDLSQSEIKFASSVLHDYMSKHGIPNYESISREDDEEIFILFSRIKMLQMAELSANPEDRNLVSDYLKAHNMKYCDINREHYTAMMKTLAENKKASIDDYMRRHGKTYDTMTDEDIIGMAEEQTRKTNKGSNAQVLALLQDYMKRHGIKRMEDMTEKDMADFQRELTNIEKAAKQKQGKKRK